MKKLAIQILVISTMLGMARLAWASEQNDTMKKNERTTAEEVKQEVTDAAEAIKNYSADKRDEAATKAKEALDALDARIEATEKDIAKNWDKMDKAAREQARRSMNALQKQRIEVAEWYGGLKNSTADAWEHMKKGFSDAYKSLRSSWEKAEREYQEENKKE